MTPNADYLSNLERRMFTDKDTAERKSVVISCRVTPSEAAQFEALTAELGLRNVGNFLRLAGMVQVTQAHLSEAAR